MLVCERRRSLVCFGSAREKDCSFVFGVEKLEGRASVRGYIYYFLAKKEIKDLIEK